MIRCCRRVVKRGHYNSMQAQYCLSPTVALFQLFYYSSERMPSCPLLTPPVPSVWKPSRYALKTLQTAADRDFLIWAQPQGFH